MKWKVRFHRWSAVFWLLLGIVSFPLGWANSVLLVWIASVYANAKTDWGAAEAADNRELKEQLDRIESLLQDVKRGMQEWPQRNTPMR